MITRRIAASATVLLLAMTPTLAQPSGEAPRWLRFAEISPDGETISFTYRGQIFVVPSDGGLAVPITSHGVYSHGAVWSPDSESMAFASTLNGTDDIYVTDFSGTLSRLSWSSRGEVPASFTPDGSSILFNARGLGDAERSVQSALSYKDQLYSVNLASGRETLVLPNFATEARWNRAQDTLVYTYDPAGDSEVRQHRVIANARQLYTFDPVSGHHQRLFELDGVDRHNPLLSADGQRLFYLSEASGTLNVWAHDLGSEEEVQLTFFEDAPVRDLSIANDGTLAFINDGRLFVRAAGAEEAQPIPVMTLDQQASMDQNARVSFADEFVSSPNGAHFALTAYGNVFLFDGEGNYRQLTSTPEEERNVAFSPDGSMLVYAAQREHKWGLYGVELGEGAADPFSIYLEETTLYAPEDGNAFQPQFSPDGSKLAFVADRREVKVLDMASGEITALFGPDDYNSSYSDGDQWFAWSPTSEDLLVMWKSLAATGTHRAAIVPADGSAPPHPISQSLSDFTFGSWSVDGSQVIGHTSLFSPRTAQLWAQATNVVSLTLSEAGRQDFLDISEGLVAPEPKRYEIDARLAEGAGRILTSGPIRSWYALSDGRNLVTVSPVGDDNYAIQLVDLSSGAAQMLQMIEAPGLEHVSFVADANVIDLKLPGSVIRVPIFDPNGVESVPVRMFTSINPDKQRRAAFEQAWADIKYHFYSSELEGRNWDAIGAKYRTYLDSIATDRELATLVETMFGELSASHLFSGMQERRELLAGLGTYTDVLGVYLDYGYEGPGRRVAEILPGGPLDRAGLEIAAGDVIASINGTDVPEAGGIERLLDVNLQKAAVIGVTDVDGGNERFLRVRPIDAAMEDQLAQQRWRETRREMVDLWSKSCVAYQHVAHMKNPDYLGLLGTMMGSRDLAKAALVDIRSNGGGNLTRELVNLLTGQAYSMVGRENGPKTHDPNNRWIGPSAVLVDSFVYSDGTIFPQAYKDAGIGTIVGDVVLNTGTYVSQYNSRILPGYSHSLPTLPVRRLDGSYYENSIVEPHIHVPYDPNTAGIGVDPQLEAAVAALMEQIGPDSDCRL